MPYVRTTLVKPRNIYSQQDLPWLMETDAASPKERLFSLLGGGMKTTAVSRATRIARRKQSRFLKFAAAFAILWTIFFFI